MRPLKTSTAEFEATAVRRQKGRALGPVLAVTQGGKAEEPSLSQAYSCWGIEPRRGLFQFRNARRLWPPPVALKAKH